MKNYIFCLFFAVFTFSVSAQETAKQQSLNPAEVATEKFATTYDLNATQTEKMLTIQTRRFNQLLQIEGLKEKNTKLYLRKLHAIYKGMDGATRLILDTRQLRTYRLNRAKLRQQKADLRQSMKKLGASEVEIAEAAYQLE